MAEYIEREAALQIIDYAKQLTSEQIVRESGTYELLSDTGKACYDGIITALAMCKRLINEAVIAADVQPVSVIKELQEQIASVKRSVKSENSDYLTGYIAALSAVEGMIDDIQPVKRGYWKEEEPRVLKCSVCGEYAPMNYLGQNCIDSKYCPWCGARMDAELNEPWQSD